LGHIYGDVVKLSYWRRIADIVVFSVVIGNIETPIVTQEEVSWPFGVNPEGVVVGVYIVLVNRFEGFTAII
jgi:hypothetical protein